MYKPSIGMMMAKKRRAGQWHLANASKQNYALQSKPVEESESPDETPSSKISISQIQISGESKAYHRMKYKLNNEAGKKLKIGDLVLFHCDDKQFVMVVWFKREYVDKETGVVCDTAFWSVERHEMRFKIILKPLPTGDPIDLSNPYTFEKLEPIHWWYGRDAWNTKQGKMFMLMMGIKKENVKFMYDNIKRFDVW